MIKVRYCACGTRLARDNAATACGACQRRATRQAPELGAEVWAGSDRARDALAERHFGRLVAAYRSHPVHGRPLSQAAVGRWLGLTQAQISRIETGPAVTDLARLIPWARALRVPPELLWFDLDSDVIRREFLQAALAAPLLRRLDHPPDAAIVEHIREVGRLAERQYEALGPQATIRTVLDQRRLAAGLLDGCPASLRPRLLSVYADLCRLTGVMVFDLGEYAASLPHFEQARGAAHQAGDSELGALILCHMAYSAIWLGRPRLAADHAVAGVAWADRASDRRLRANAHDMAARAFAAAGDAPAALAELDRAGTALAGAGAERSLVGWYDEPFLTSIRGQCLLTLRRPDEALTLIEPAARALDPDVSVKNLAMTNIDLATAHTQRGEIDAAADALARATHLAGRNRSVRLATRLAAARRALAPWNATPALTTLDDHLAED